MQGVSGGPSLYHFYFLDVSLGMWVPHCRSIFQQGSHKGLICCCLGAVDLDVSSEESQVLIHLGGDVFLPINLASGATVAWCGCAQRSPDLNLTPLAAFLHIFFDECSEGQIVTCPWALCATQKCVAPESFNVSYNSAQMLCIDRKPLGLSKLNDTNIISFGVPGRISSAVESTNFTTIVFTLPHVMAPKFANQLPIRNVGRTCNSSENASNWESWCRCKGTPENAAPHKIRCDNFF